MRSNRPSLMMLRVNVCTRVAYVVISLLSCVVGEGFSPAASTPSILVTSADGTEGFSLSMALLELNHTHVIAGVSSLDSNGSKQLAEHGAEIRVVSFPPQPSSFAGLDWVLFLPPLTSDRLQKTKQLIDTAVTARVPNAFVLSVTDADLPEAPSSLRVYLQIEEYLSVRWDSGNIVVLRTEFYQQNLELWATSVKDSNSTFLLPFTGCFAPLYETDVSSVIDTIVTRGISRANRDTNCTVLNLMGPKVLSLADVAAAASIGVGQPIHVETVNRTIATGILTATGALDPSEVELLLDLLLTQTSHRRCVEGVSEDIARVTGHSATGLEQFFAENAKLFRTETYKHE